MTAKRAVEMEEEDEEVELGEPTGDVEEEDAEEEAEPVVTKKSKPAKKARAEEDEEEEEEEETEPAAKKKVASGSKVAKKGGKVMSEKKKNGKRLTLFQRYGTPFRPDSLIAQLFVKAQKGITVAKFDAFVEDNKTKKKGGVWIKSFLRKGVRNGAKWTWTEEDGVIKISNVKAA